MDSDSHLTPIPSGDGGSSLSAILLDPYYNEFIQAGRRVLEGLPIVGPDRLIPLKARAWPDLREHRAAGERVDERDVRKHRNDIVRLYSVLDPAIQIDAPASIRVDLQRFLMHLPGEGGLSLPDLGLRNTTVDGLVQALYRIYGLA